jgi:hypothetical protein
MKTAALNAPIHCSDILSWNLQTTDIVFTSWTRPSEIWKESLPDRLAEILWLQSHVPVLYKKKATLLATIWKQICESYRILIFHQAMSHVVPDLKWKHFCAYLSSVAGNSEVKIRMNWIRIVGKTALIIFLCICTVL